MDGWMQLAGFLLLFYSWSAPASWSAQFLLHVGVQHLHLTWLLDTSCFRAVSKGFFCTRSAHKSSACKNSRRRPRRRMVYDVWSHDQCVGQVNVRHPSGTQQVWAVRNLGGGTSACCHMHPVAAAAKVDGTQQQIHLNLEPRAGQDSRNGARVYLADQCTEGDYQPAHYTALRLMGKTMSIDVDLSAAGCNCNVAWYVVPMRGNSNPGNCEGDYYCDANNVCGVRCDEVDLMEANTRAFHSAAHTLYDGGGQASGYGGGQHAFRNGQYGPAASTIDTMQPFRVHAFFGTSGGSLTAIRMTLEQQGKTLQFSMAPSWYMRRLTASFEAGMTPVMSYWSSSQMDWLNSPPCGRSTSTMQDACGEVAVLSNMAICDGEVLCAYDSAAPPSPVPVPPPPPLPSPPPPPSQSLPSPPAPPPPSSPAPPSLSPLLPRTHAPGWSASPPAVEPRLASSPAVAAPSQPPPDLEAQARMRVGYISSGVLIATLLVAGLAWLRTMPRRARPADASANEVSSSTSQAPLSARSRRGKGTPNDLKMDSANPAWCKKSGDAAEPDAGRAPTVTSSRRTGRATAVRWDQLEMVLDDGVPMAEVVQVKQAQPRGDAQPRAPVAEVGQGKSVSLAQQAQLD